MILHVAGVHQFDPKGPSALEAWLAGLFISQKSTPGFVAVEYDRHLFEQIREQRPLFRLLLQKEWPHVSPTLLDILEPSLGYEGDSHIEVFSNVTALCLEEGAEESVDKYAQARLNLYKCYLGGKLLPENTATALTMLSGRAW